MFVCLSVCLLGCRVCAPLYKCIHALFFISNTISGSISVSSSSTSLSFICYFFFFSNSLRLRRSINCRKKQNVGRKSAAIEKIMMMMRLTNVATMAGGKKRRFLCATHALPAQNRHKLCIYMCIAR